MKVFIDMDGVLCDFVRPAFVANGMDYPYDDPAMHGQLSCVRENGFWDICDQDFWATLPPTDDGEAIVVLLEKYFRRENIAILTSPAPCKGCVEGKMQWIRKHYPEFKHNVVFTGRKHFYANRYSILVDDNHENIDAFKRRGHGILIPRIWNRMHTYDQADVLIWVEHRIRQTLNPIGVRR